MINHDKKKVLEILDYWKMIEFLGQIDIPQESPDNRSVLRKIEKGESVKEKQIEIFSPLPGLSLDLPDHMASEAKHLAAFPAVSEKVAFLLGRVERNAYAGYLDKFVPNRQEAPELPYPQNSAFAWCSFYTDTEGVYQKGSFRLSPLLWALSEWEKSRADRNHIFHLNTDEYDAIVNEIDEELDEENVSDFLQDIYNRICKDYVVPSLRRDGTDSRGIPIYTRYAGEEEKETEDETKDPADLGRSFFLNDIRLCYEAVLNNQFGDGSEYERRVIDYILSASRKQINDTAMGRTVISPDEPSEKMRAFFEDILDIENAPSGKWPAKFMPALMQQVAVNLAIKRGADECPVFSVNGPPGTGKTTLLKEIVANHIVERAKLLTKYEKDPDSAFEKCSFTEGPLEDRHHAYYLYAPNYYKLKDDEINDYGMLVASCNNAAVENITLDLPKAGDILDSLEPSDDDEEAVGNGLKEVHDLYDLELSDDIDEIEIGYKKETKQEKDIYFTRYANALLGVSDCWGLVSAPFGKRANIRKYCAKVLKPIIEEYRRNEHRDRHKKKFGEWVEKFNRQLKVVEDLRRELREFAVLTGKPGAETSSGYRAAREKYSSGQNKMDVIDSAFMDAYTSSDEKTATNAQVTNPWFTPGYNREREKLFLYACKVHKEFVLASKAVRHNVINLLIAWNLFDDCTERMKTTDREAAMPALLQTVFLITPVISTTFASAQTFLGDVKESGVLGTLVVDESGQAQPQMSIGAMFRCRKAVIVGDPKQIEPVVTAETDVIKQLLTSPVLGPYKDKRLSVQGFADFINPYGTYLGEDEEKEWVGCPLVVHRRCIDPMYTISNVLSYDGTMKQQTRQPKESRCASFILEKSVWIQVKGKENSSAKDHFVRAQGELVLKMLEKKLEKDPSEIPALFIISPFTSVKNGMKEMIMRSELYKKDKRVKQWLADDNIGTVHTFQGQGTDEVIFLLGCDSHSVSAANWVNKNIVNVAATRAKFRFYVIGDKDVWTCKPVRVAREEMEMISAEELYGLLGYPVEKQASDLPEYEICPECGKPLKERTGKYGPFLGCSGFPKCRYIKKIKKK